MRTHRLVALLRAINVGGHTVTMERLRALFAELGLRNVETLIASGNALFDAPRAGAKSLERRIERHLHAALGYEVATFVRSPAEMAAAAAYRSPSDLRDGETAVLVGFLRSTPTNAAGMAAMALETETDRLELVGRELYWTRHGRISDSKLGGGLLEKALGLPMTMRNITTVRKLAVRCTEMPAK